MNMIEQLQHAILRSDILGVESIYEQDHQAIHFVDKKKQTALHYAMRIEKLDIFKWLVQAGVPQWEEIFCTGFRKDDLDDRSVVLELLEEHLGTPSKIAMIILRDNKSIHSHRLGLLFREIKVRFQLDEYWVVANHTCSGKTDRENASFLGIPLDRFQQLEKQILWDCTQQKNS